MSAYGTAWHGNQYTTTNCYQPTPCPEPKPNCYPPKVIDIPNSSYEAQKGNYFIGQTPFLTLAAGNGMIALVNPIGSNVNIYIYIITISNFQNSNINAMFYVESTFPSTTTPLTSNLVSNTNLTLYPLPTPKGQIQYVDSTILTPSGGTPILNRIAPNGTIVDEFGGRLVLPPGKMYMAYLTSPLTPTINNASTVVFGWWEEQLLCPPCSCYDRN